VRMACVRLHTNEHPQTADYSPVELKNAHAVWSSAVDPDPGDVILEFRMMVRSVLPVA